MFSDWIKLFIMIFNPFPKNMMLNKIYPKILIITTGFRYYNILVIR